MNVILGASGQIGSGVVKGLSRLGKPVRAIIRDPEKAKTLDDVEVIIADFFDLEALKAAFKGGHSVFLITPENSASGDVLGETKTILHHYREAIISSGIKKMVGLSSIGAQHRSGTGNLEMSYLLEHSFEDLPVEQTFVRPAYYFSNWLGYYDTVKQEGILPTFFPVDQKIPMTAPTDVARFVAGIMASETYDESIVEVTGPTAYSSRDVADVCGEILNKNVEVYQIPEESWESTLIDVGFSDDATPNMIRMIQAVIDEKALPEKNDNEVVKLETGLSTYFAETLKKH